LGLDLANTLGERWSKAPREHLTSYRDLVSWARQGELIDERQAHRLLRRAEQEPAAATDTLARAIDLREAIYRIFDGAATGRAPARRDVEVINGLLPRALAQLELVGVGKGGRGFAWRWRDDPNALDRMLWPVVKSAADLLADLGHGQVRVCAADDCA